MRKKVTILLFVALSCLVPSLTAPYFIVQANPLEPQKISVILLSPENITYTPNNLRLTFRVSHWTNYNIETWYTLDNQASVRLSLGRYQGSLGSSTYDSSITGLKDGSHVIKVHSSSGEIGSEREMFFTIDSTSPIVSNISIENKTYPNTDLMLNYTISERASWVAYSLDSQANVSIIGYATANLWERSLPLHHYQVNDSVDDYTILTDLTKGSHSLIIYANDTAGNMCASQTVIFTIDKPELFPTVPVAAISAVVVALVAAGLLVYAKKGKRGSIAA